MLLRALVALAFGLLPVSFAQFNFFDMFGQQQHHDQHQRPSGTSQWAAHSESVPCSSYLCPNTLVCAQGPIECPCPNVEDVRCVIPDVQDKGAGTVVCVRGGEECKEVERLTRGIRK